MRMDEIDFRLCLQLRENSRRVYRQMADDVDLSVNAVHMRIRNLVDKGIIDGFYADIGLNALKGSMNILIHGFSSFDDIDGTIEEFSKDDNTSKLITTSDDYLYIHGLLRDISEMSGYVEGVPEIAGMDEPKIFIPDVGRTHAPDITLTTTDYQIIHSMHEDSRKSLSDVGEELGVSTKTVRRRIDKLEEAEAVDYSIRWYPVHSDDFIGILHGDMKSKNRGKKLSSIKKKHYPYIFEGEKASNHPDKILLKTWANNLSTIHKIKDDLKKTEDYETIKTRMFYDKEYFKTWRDDLLEERAQEN